MHGNDHGLIASDADGRIQVISSTALEETFGVDGWSVKIAVLAACFTAELSAALLAHIDCVVGMQGAIHDDAARYFSTGFYRGVVEGESVQEAFRRGRLAIRLAGLEGDVDRAELTNPRSGEPLADQFRAESLPDSCEARRGFMPMGEVMVRHAAQVLNVLMVGIVLGSTEEDVPMLPHEKIGKHHQVRRLVGKRTLRLSHPEVGVDLFHWGLRRFGL